MNSSQTTTGLKTSKPRIVILGGGFGGVYTAKALEKLLGKHDDYEIVLVNRENYLVFQPMLPEVISGSIDVLDPVTPIRRMLKKTNIYVRTVQDIDLEKKMVTLSPGFRPRPMELEYDHLVLALGNVTDFRGMTGVHEHALPFKNLADAINLRNHLLHVLEEAQIEPDEDLRRELLTFVVAGGGFSGVEVCAELNDFVRGVLKNYPHISNDDIRVVLVHSGNRILNKEFPEDLSLYAQRILRKKGVELILENRLATATPESAVISDGTKIPTRTLVSTVPSFPNPMVEKLAMTSVKKGRVLVDHYLQAQDSDAVWALGDCAIVPMANDAGFCPATAQFAVRQANVVAHNIVAHLRGREKKEFSFAGLGTMGSLGHHTAVAQLGGGIKLSGILAWFFWRSVYWAKLPGWDRKVRVGMDWFMKLFFPPDLVQMKIQVEDGIRYSHYEPGEVILRKGDQGDGLYIMLKGSAYVLAEDDSDEPLARISPGEYFGEIALLDNSPRTATVKAQTPADVMILQTQGFKALTANVPQFRRLFEVLKRRRMAHTEQQAEAQSENNVSTDSTAETNGEPSE